MVTQHHYFYAIKIPDEVKEAVHQEMEKLKLFFPFKTWVHEQDYHITLAFLGGSEDGKLAYSKKLVQQAINEKVFSLSLHALNVFGNENCPRIFWGSVSEEPSLFRLQHSVHQACRQAGYTLESRPFTPHMTIARRWVGEDFHKEWLYEYNPFQPSAIDFFVREVVLYQTHMDKIPKYKEIANFPLLLE